MSIYSGFSTRSLESAYNSFLYEAINLLQSLILEHLRSKKYQESSIWCETFSNTFSKLSKLEKKKHLQPNFSSAMKDLDSYIKSLGNYTIYEKPIKIPSRSNISVSSLPKEDLDHKAARNHRYSSINSATSRESHYPSIIKPPIRHRKNLVKSYQDQILKSILKDLSSPLNEFSNY